MKAPIPISDAEWQVMEVIWPSPSIAAAEVIEQLAKRASWSPRTVKSLLNRLLKKGALTYEAEGKRYLYRPTVSRDACVRAEGRSFLSRVFGGQAGAMLVHLVKDADLSPAEIRELKRLLHEKGADE